MTEYHIAEAYPAGALSVDKVLRAAVETDNGRSRWYWLRLANGDLMLGVYPRGDTYFEVEGLVEYDYNLSKSEGTHSLKTYDEMIEVSEQSDTVETVSRNRSFDTENPRALSDCRWWDGQKGQTFDCWGRVGFVYDDDTDANYVECEGHFNNKKAGA